MRTALAGQGSELLGNRIVELPESESGLRNRDAHSGFIAYVPEGSLAKGKFLVTRANERGVACTACHGRTLNGRGGLSAPMRAVAARLGVDEMLAIAAYLASLPPNRSD